MPDIYDTAKKFRLELLARDRDAIVALINEYGIVWREIRRQIVDFLGRFTEVDDKNLSLAQLFQVNRLRALEDQVKTQIHNLLASTESRIIAGQSELISLSLEHANELASIAVENEIGISVLFAKLPTSAIVDLVGFLSDGSPLHELFSRLGDEFNREVRKSLIVGVATGQHPIEVAKNIRSIFGRDLSYALTVARTEMLRAYRESSRRFFEANQNVIKGWIWHSATNARTCAFCWSMHGTFHPVDELMATHPRCRCTLIPSTRSFKEIRIRSVKDQKPVIIDGPKLFDKLPSDMQRQILGRSKFLAYQDGAISLEDLRGFRRDPRWGPVGYERSLVDILGSEQAKKYA